MKAGERIPGAPRPTALIDTLRDQTGKAFSPASLRGRFVAIVAAKAWGLGGA